MDILNRSAVILHPKRPYLEWMKQDDAGGLADGVFESLREEPYVYLVPGFDDGTQRAEVLRELWPALFEELLNGWVTDEASWPKGRTFEMFSEWFDVQTYSMIVDVYLDEALDYEG